MRIDKMCDRTIDRRLLKINLVEKVQNYWVKAWTGFGTHFVGTIMNLETN
jgi:hypothetical protein